jgi:photosystem II stability/assembly factor-like uncharacterized protein
VGLVVAAIVALVASIAPPVGSSTAAAPSGFWTETGPLGTTVTTLAIDSGDSAVVYAGVKQFNPAPADPLVYRSTNGGRSWTGASNGLPREDNVSPSRLVAVPSTPGTVFLEMRQRLFRTQDGGGTWSRIDNGLVADAVRSVAVDPTSPAVLYVGTSSALFKSTDGGATWNPANTGLTSGEVQWLAVAPSSPMLLYALTFGGLFRSADGAATWQSGSNEITASATGFAVDATVPTTLYAAARGGAFRSTDGGTSWNPINTGLAPTSVQTLTADRTQSGVLYAATSETMQLGAVT